MSQTRKPPGPGFLKKVTLTFLICAGFGGPAQGRTVFLTEGSSWTVPAGWTSSSNTIEVIGGGGNGGFGGGGGGAYSRVSNLALTPGSTVAYSVGIVTLDTWFCNSVSNCASISGLAVKVGAKGGSPGDGSAACAGGAGGQAASGVGEVKYSGGSGGAGSFNNNAGAGGGAAGPYGAGGAGGLGNGTRGGGGGGGGGGSGGGSANTLYTGSGGSNRLGAGGGAAVSVGNGYSGSAGGGGSGGVGITGWGGMGGNGTEWGSVGAGGGSGGTGWSTGNYAPAGLYGAGSSFNSPAAQGIIVITYDEPPSASFGAAPPAFSSGTVSINYYIVDHDSQTCNITNTAAAGVQYSLDYANWYNCTAGSGGDGTSGLSSDAAGKPHVFNWNTAADLPGVEKGAVWVRIRPNDGAVDAPSWAISAPFAIDNKAPFRDLFEGCGYWRDVAKNGGGHYTTIQAALNALPTALSTATCVVIRDTQTYSEQVTVQGFANNGYQLRIMADPSFVSSAPVVNPPAASTAAFHILNSGVLIDGLTVLSTNAVPYGILASSAGTAIAWTGVSGGAKITAAAVSLSSSGSVSDSSLSADNVPALRLGGGSYTVIRSTVTSRAAGAGAVYLNKALSVSILDSYIKGSTAVYVSGSTNTAIGGSALVSTWPAGVGLSVAGGSMNLSLSTSAVSGGAQGSAVYLGNGNTGVLGLSSNTILGGAYGLNIAAQGAGAQLSVASVTFQNLSAGATAVNFLGGQFISTFSAAAFDSANISVNVNGALLAAGSRVNMLDYSGVKAGGAYENDPLNRVFWDIIPPAAVSDLAAGAVSTGAAALAWTAPGNDGTEGALDNSAFLIQSSTYAAVLWSTSAAQTAISTAGVNPGAAQSLVLSGLFPNTPYYFRLWTRDDYHNYGGTSNLASTATLANAPPAPRVAAVYPSSMTAAWTALPLFPSSSSCGGYAAEVSTVSGFAGVLYSSATVDPAAAELSIEGLDWANTTYYFRIGSYNPLGRLSYAQTVATVTLPLPVSGVQLDSVFMTSAAVSWTPLAVFPASASCAGYLAQASTAPDFSGLLISSRTASSSAAGILIAGLGPDLDYYFRAGPVNWSGTPNFTAIPGSGHTVFELTSPVITDGEGEDPVWRGANTRAYAVSFTDSGGSMLFKVQARAATGPAGGGTVTADWTDILTEINSDSYPGPWPLTADLWALLPEGVTNYISVRVYDGSLNADSVDDAFKVLKDTTPPSRQGPAADPVWLSSPAVNDVDFYDATSRLRDIQYSAWTAPAQGGAQVVPWTDLVVDTAVAAYTADWTLPQGSWELLRGGTNYISLRAWDYSVPANSSTWTDAFRVLKDTSAPDPISWFPASAVSTSSFTGKFAAPQESPSGIELFALQYATYTVVWSTSSAQDAALNSTHVYVSTSGRSAGAQSAFHFGGLSPNTSYYLRAWSRDRALNWSAVSGAGDAVTLPKLITGAQFGGVFYSSAAVSWTALPAAPSSSSCRGYLVQASSFPDFAGTVLASATADSQASSLVVDGLLPGVTYYFRAGAVNWSGAPNYAAPLSTATRDNAAPDAVGDLDGVAVASGTIEFFWTSPGDNGSFGALEGGGFIVQYTTDPAEAASPPFWSTASAQVSLPASGAEPGAALYHDISGLLSAVTYYASLWTEDEAGNLSPRSNTAAVHMPPPPPTAPQITAVHVSSVSFSWDANGNPPDAVYTVSRAGDSAFTIGVVDASTAAGSYALSGLSPNREYFMRVKTAGTDTIDSDFTGPVSTVTLAAPVAGVSVSEVFSSSAALDWSDISNPEGTAYSVGVSSDDFATLNYSSGTAQTTLTLDLLSPAVTYYFRVEALNAPGAGSGFVHAAPAMTRAAPPVPAAVAFSSVTTEKVDVSWLKNGNPVSAEYYLKVSTAPDFTGADIGPQAWAAWTAVLTVSPLDAGATFYFEVRARDALLRETAWLYIGSTLTPSGADIVPPSVIDTQAGDDAWRSASGGFYAVGFRDLASGLDKFQVRLSTSPGGAAPPLADWTDVVSDINAGEYTDLWQLPDAVFRTISESATAYVSVRAYDLAAPPNVTVSTDVFYVRRDTNAPVIINNAVSPAGWLLLPPGPFDVNFFDLRAGLAAVQYSASGSAGAADAALLDWTNIAVFASSISYLADWSVDFSALASGVTNYISVRGIDTAGNAATLADAFYVLKAADGPGVSFLSPSAAYVSTVSSLSGSASGGNPGITIAAAEVALRELSSGNYYDGASGFSSAVRVWLSASGTESWSLGISTFGLVNLSSYTATARALDNYDRYSLVYSTITFTLDQDAPSVHLSSPIALSTVYALDSVSGTAADAGAGPALAGISVKRLIDGKWWNFPARDWGTAQVSSAAPVAAGAWTFIPDLYLRGNMLDGATYFVTSRAYDAAAPANSSDFGVSGSSFVFSDIVPPGQITAVSASSGVLPGRLVARWTSSGDDGAEGLLALGEFAVKYSTVSGFSYSTGSAQVLVSTASVPPGSARSYTISELSPAATYYLRLWIKDDAGLWSPVSPEFSGLSAEGLANEIAGHVRTSAGQGITGVLVQGWSNLGGVWSAYTVDDGSGSFRLTGLTNSQYFAEAYRVQATWTADGIASSVAKDQIPVGYADADFTLSVTYQLASVSGTLSLSASGRRASALGGGAEVELWQNGSRIASVKAAADGSFRISNILPGTYELRASGIPPVQVTVRAGENLVIGPMSELILGDSLYVYPNPARDRVTFRLQTEVPSAKIEITVFDLLGRLVKKIRDNDPGWDRTNPNNIYLAAWEFPKPGPASGVYIYKVNMKQRETGKTLVKTGKFAIVR